MKQKLITTLVQTLLVVLSPELLRRFADMVLDFAENYVLGTKSEIDDSIVLPICQCLRAAFGIEDNDGPSE